MARIDFDDLVKVITVENTNIADAIVSTEIDLELPRGYIAKIKRTILCLSPNSLRGNIVAANPNNSWNSALVLDPDDAATFAIPLNEVQHDVLSEWSYTISMDATDDITTQYETPKVQNFVSKDGFDAVTARNVRFNTQQIVADPDAVTRCTIYYTLERVTDADILALLDIL